MANLQLLRSDASGATYASLSDPDYTVRFKTVQQNKSLSGKTVANYVTEIIVNDIIDVDVSGVTVPEAISVRFKVSGSNQGAVTKHLIAGSLASQISTWTAEGVFEGFRPTTLPVVPAVS